MTSLNQGLSIVLVYLGNNPPKYVGSNLSYMKNQFPDADIWLITDSHRTKRKFEKSGHQVWLFEDSDKYWTSIHEGMDFPREFRNGFWFLTLKRFKALEVFMGEHPSSIIHVEADVLLMPNFPFNYFLSIKKELAYPMVGPGYAIASTLFIRDIRAIASFNYFIEEQTLDSAHDIDMTLLFKYQRRFPERVEILPSGPAFDGHAFGYFDGAAFGTYLLGQDPRNFRGMTLKYSPIEWHIDKIQVLDFEVNGQSLIAIVHDTQTPIYSLHIHSKNPNLFKIRSLTKSLNKSIVQHSLGPRKIIAPRVLLPILHASLKRRIRRAIRAN